MKAMCGYMRRQSKLSFGRRSEEILMAGNQPENRVRNRILWITRTGVLIAMLITLQWLTAGTQVFAGQYITGTCVNCVLAVSALAAGLHSGICVALMSPFFAFLLKIGPAVPQIVPCIAMGNIAFVLSLNFLIGKHSLSSWKKYAGLLISACVKFIVLFVLVTKIFIPLMGEGLAPKQITMFTTMFSWSQLITALLGGLIAMLILPVIQKFIKKRR